jgi:DNA repair ATPase RecN
MSWFDKLQANLQDAANKAGLTPEKLQSVADTLNRELAKVPDHAKALKAAAEQHGIEVGKIQEALDHAGAEMTKVVDSVASEAFGKTPPPPKP